MSGTYHVRVTREHEPAPNLGDFTPWRNCRSVDDVCRLAASNYLREAGYMSARAERPVLTLNVYCYPDDIDRHAESGRPVAVMMQTLKCTPA